MTHTECKECGAGLCTCGHINVVQCPECQALIRINRAAGARVPHWLEMELKEAEPAYTRNEAHPACECGNSGDCNDCEKQSRTRGHNQ